MACAGSRPPATESSALPTSCSGPRQRTRADFCRPAVETPGLCSRVLRAGVDGVTHRPSATCILMRFLTIPIPVPSASGTSRHRPLPRPRGPADPALHPRQAEADQAAGGAEAGHHPPRRHPRPRPQRPPQALGRGVAGGCAGALGGACRSVGDGLSRICRHLIRPVLSTLASRLVSVRERASLRRAARCRRSARPRIGFACSCKGNRQPTSRRLDLLPQRSRWRCGRC